MTTIIIPEDGSATYDSGKDYLIDGGTLSLDASAGLLGFGKSSWVSATVGPNGGNIDVKLDSSIFSGLSGNYEYVVSMSGPPPKNLVISFELNAPNKKVITTYKDGMTTVSIKVTGGFIITSTMNFIIQIPGNPNNMAEGSTAQYYFGPGDNDGSFIIRCYAKGTFIETPTGKIRVEDLKVGDLITTLSETGKTALPVKWIGKRLIRNGTGSKSIVNVRKDAIDQNIPDVDLLITPEHCLFLEGHLVPVRMLVNGGSISYIDDQHVEVYHFELDEHSIVSANNLLSESYLDTGCGYDIETTLKDYILIGEGRYNWQTNAAAPLCLDATLTEQIYLSLKERGDQIGYATQSRDFIYEQKIALVDKYGAEKTPDRTRGRNHIFVTDSLSDFYFIKSEHISPSYIIGPYIDDRRELGVLVGNITIFSPEKTYSLTRHLDDVSLLGWHCSETPEARWTDGYAMLPIEQGGTFLPSVIAIEILSYGPELYLHDNSQPRISDRSRTLAMAD